MLASASRSRAKTDSTESASSSPLTIFLARTSNRSSPYASSPSSISCPSTTSELWSPFATSLSASAWRLFQSAMNTMLNGLIWPMRLDRRDACRMCRRSSPCMSVRLFVLGEVLAKPL